MPQKPSKFALLQSDIPLKHPKDDRLGYLPFAELLATGIAKMAPHEGMVVGIYGSWGSGKTTVANFIEHILQHDHSGEQFALVRFNPWWLSGTESVTRRFFDFLLSELGLQRFPKKVTKALEAFGSAVTDLKVSAGSVEVNPGEAVIRGVRTFLSSDFAQHKEIVSKILAKQQRRVLVIVDDIDRLPTEDIRELFRVIKVIGDLPNIIYLLLLDKDVVTAAIDAPIGLSGEIYLEKIVQVPFDLPLPDEDFFRALFIDEFNATFPDPPPGTIDNEYFSTVYKNGIEHFIHTPRRLLRLLNTLKVTYNAVRTEVNFVDFVAIETLRLYCPSAYKCIRTNPSFFARDTVQDLVVGKDEKLKFYDEFFESLSPEDRQPVKHILRKIFPKLEGIISPAGISGGSYKGDSRRIVESQSFPLYFQFSPPGLSVTLRETQELLQLGTDKVAFRASLLRLTKEIRPNGTTRLLSFLDRVRDSIDTVPQTHVIPILDTILDIGDQLLCPGDHGHGFLGMPTGNEVYIDWLMLRLVERIDKTGRGQVLASSIQNSNSLATIVELLHSLGREHGKHYGTAKPGKERLVTATTLKALEKLALRKIEDARKNGTLALVPLLKPLMLLWSTWTSRSKVQVWVAEVLANNTLSPTFLEHFFIDKAIGNDSLELYISPSKLVTAVKSLQTKTKLSERQTVVMGQILDDHQKSERPVLRQRKRPKKKRTRGTT